MVSLIGYAMVRQNNHLPEEMYRKIMSYLIPKYLLDIPEIKNYNKVMAAIPGFDPIIPECLTLPWMTEKFGYVTTKDYTIRYFYRLTNNLTTIRYITVYLPFRPGENHQEQYDDYHRLQYEKGRKRDLQKAIYG